MGAADLPWMKIGISCCCCVVVLVGAVVALSSVQIVTSVSCGVLVDSNARVLLNSSSFGGRTFTLDNMTVLPSPSLYSELRAELFDSWVHEASGHTYGLADVHEAPMILYNGTKIDGNWEDIPRAVTGVFWMRGSSGPETLATMQYGQWFPEEKLLLFPSVPFSQTWRENETSPAQALAESKGEENVTVAVAFQPCPEKTRDSREDTHCETASEDFTFAEIESHSAGNLAAADVLTSHVTWSMEDASPEGEQHSVWYRRASLFCGKTGFDSYWLTKILDENGDRIEPYYSEYVDYMQGGLQIIWSGFGRGHHLE